MHILGEMHTALLTEYLYIYTFCFVHQSYVNNVILLLSRFHARFNWEIWCLTIMGYTDANIEYFIHENKSYIQILSPNTSNLTQHQTLSNMRLPIINIFEQTILLQFLSGSVRSRASMCIHLMHIFKQYETKWLGNEICRQ